MGFSVLQIWPIFGSVFALKTAVFRFWCLVRFAGFLQFSLWFSVFVNNNGGFSEFFRPMYSMVFLVLPWKLHPGVALNCNPPEEKRWRLVHLPIILSAQKP